MTQEDLRIGRYRRAVQSRFTRILALSVRHHLVPESETRQSLTLELAPDDLSESITLTFSNVHRLHFADLQPGCACYLNIAPIPSRQGNGLRYKVHSLDAGLTLEFYCASFEIAHMPHAVAG
jgi:hypothetical protein